MSENFFEFSYCLGALCPIYHISGGEVYSYVFHEKVITLVF